MNSLFGQSEIDQEELVAVTSNSHQEVVWLYVTMDEVLHMDVLDASYHLVSQHENSLKQFKLRMLKLCFSVFSVFGSFDIDLPLLSLFLNL